jgi:hypothetical protein
MHHAVDHGGRPCAPVNLAREFQGSVRIESGQQAILQYPAGPLAFDVIEHFHAIGQRYAGAIDVIARAPEHTDRQCVGQIAEHAAQHATQRGGQSPVTFEHLLIGVACVAPEDFVAAVTGQHHRASVLARHAGTQVGRHGRSVPERLVVQRRDPGDCSRHVGGRHIVFVGLAAEMGGRDAGVLHLIEAFRVEADGIGVRAVSGNTRHDAGDGRTVGAAAQEGAHFVPGADASHRLFEQFAEARRVAFVVVTCSFIAAASSYGMLQ